MAQARAVAASLGGESAGVSLEIMQTRGDRLREMRFSEQLDKGFFTTELEQALADGRVDLVVHSLKICRRKVLRDWSWQPRLSERRQPM